MTKIVNGQAAPLLSASPARSFNLKYFNVVLFSLLAGLGIFYLVNINDLTVQGFALQDLKAQSANLASANLDVQEQVNLAQSYSSLDARVQGLHLVAVSNVEYLSGNDLSVAKK
jgi:hypothetical protein